MLAHPERFRGKKVGLVLCGGNIDTRLLANVLLRDLARAGPPGAAPDPLQDRPGALTVITQVLRAHGVNILEIYHQRIFTDLPAKGSSPTSSARRATASAIEKWSPRSRQGISGRARRSTDFRLAIAATALPPWDGRARPWKFGVAESFHGVNRRIRGS